MQASEVFLTPELHPLDLAHLCTQFLQELFRSELGRHSSESIGVAMAPLPVPPIMLPVSLTVVTSRQGRSPDLGYVDFRMTKH
jgi:hypothetical protein